MPLRVSRKDFWKIRYHTSVAPAISTVKMLKALEMRAAGEPLDVVAANLGVSINSAKKYILKAMKYVLQEPAEEVRKLELERLDMLWHAVYPKAMTGNSRAIDSALNIMRRRAKLLGLDEPEKQEHSGAIKITYVNDWRNTVTDAASGSGDRNEPSGED